MYWTEIEGDELQRLRSRIELPPQSTILEASTLRTPFYHNGELVKINDGAGSMFMVAAGPGELSARDYYPLNGSGSDIHAANKAAKLVITQDNAGDYLRYFTAFLRNDEGEPFAIIESLNSFGLVNKDRQNQQKPEDMRLVCEGANVEGDAFAFRGYMAYEGQLFGVSVLVHTNGYVEMLDDDPMGFIVPLH
ncbi:MAG: hypothetical protein ACREDM_00075 [Methylocella sp.]